MLEVIRYWIRKIRQLKIFNSRIAPPHSLTAVACSRLELCIADDVTV